MMFLLFCSSSLVHLVAIVEELHLYLNDQMVPDGTKPDLSKVESAPQSTIIASRHQAAITDPMNQLSTKDKKNSFRSEIVYTVCFL